MSYFEPRFGSDFCAVRIHTGIDAAYVAQALKARAFTLGNNIIFGSGQYAPDSQEGGRLLAHELTHVLQQRSGLVSDRIQRENGGSTPPPAPTPPTTTPPAPAYGPTCSGGDTDPCQIERCGDRREGIEADIDRAISYVERAITAVGTTPLAEDTIRSLDWFFNDHSLETADTVRTRLRCILACLQDTRDTPRFGCHPEYNRRSALAYVCVSETPVCEDAEVNVCLTRRHFGKSDRVRAETMIHECAHRVGMSLGAPASVDDIYDHMDRFRFMDTSECLLNSDSFAIFAGSITNGVRLSILLPILQVAAGMAVPTEGEPTWHARIYEGVEFQHPILGIFNPTLGFGMSFIGETTSEEDPTVSAGPTMLMSLLAGVRIGDPRPGAAGGGYASFFGGPALAIGLGGEGDVDIGAEAGMALGYRWRWLDVSGGVGYTYDPTRISGMEHLFTVGASLTFAPSHLYSPRSH